jgi:ABC-type protease/lipase transport system fused ATPase/permease subunit
MALVRAIEALRNNQCIVVLVSHRPDAIAALNVAMVLYEGRMIAFGPREEIFARVARQAKAPTPLKPKSAGAETPSRAPVVGVPQ